MRAHRDRQPTPAEALGNLSERRRKLLELYYAGEISGEGFKEEEERLLASIETARDAAIRLQVEDGQDRSGGTLRGNSEILRALGIDRVWDAANDEERRVLVEELVESITVHPDHLEVKVFGVPALNVLYGEVGLKVSEIVGVGDGVWFQDISDI